MITLKFGGGACEFSGVIRRDVYRAGDAPALLFEEENGEQIGVLSVNLVDALLPDENHTFIKDWSENEGILAQLIEQGIVRDTGVRVGSGHVRVPMVEILAPELRQGAPIVPPTGGEDMAADYRARLREEGKGDPEERSYIEAHLQAVADTCDWLREYINDCDDKQSASANQARDLIGRLEGRKVREWEDSGDNVESLSEIEGDRPSR